MNNFKFIAIIALLFFASCSSGGTEGSLNSAYVHCLAGFNYQYNEMLTKADVQKHVTIDENTFKENLDTKNETYGSVNYSWDSGRPNNEVTMSGFTLPVPDDNFVRMRLLSFYDASDLKLYNQEDFTTLFDQSYKRISDEEYESLRANLEKGFKGSEESLKTAISLLDGRRKQTYVLIEGVGDRAYWRWHDERGLEMAVMAGEANFNLEVKISEDTQENVQVATALVQEILAKCGA